VTPTGNPGEDQDATVYSLPAGRKAFQRSALNSDASVQRAEGRAIDLASVSGVNPVVAAANPLLSLVPQLRSSMSHPDSNGLRDMLLRQIGEFEKAARDRGVSVEHVLVARYALCTLVDESISLTPWGGGGQWTRFGMLVTLYKETSGGEKFYLLLGKMAEDPAKNLFLLELMHICLALGFEGKYRVMSGGKVQLEDVRERLYNMIRKQRGEAERDLSPHWRGLATSTVRTVRFLPLWATAAVAALLLVGVFIALAIALNSRSDNVFAMLAKLRVQSVRAAAPPPKVVAPRLSVFLTDEIAKKLVVVTEDDTASHVSILGDGLFEPGSALIEKSYEAVIARVTDAVNKVPGQVTVTGHTDDRPIRSVRFPSNWHLSQERAASVLRLMSKTIDNPARLKADGRADTVPVAPNDSEVNRARNRRVEILLKVNQ
jgi:type VI secretion system protein ImpK